MAGIPIDADGRFSGYASVFGRLDGGGDIVMPGAFAQSLGKRRERIRLLFQHDPKEPVGIWEAIGEDTDGKSFKSVLGDIARSFADLALKAAIKPLGSMLGGLVENLFTASNPALGRVTPFAKGGVIASPSYFPLRGGLGLAGEAGPEAIMPLQRGADGRLGVAAGSGGGGVQVTFNVTASDARSFVQSEAEVSAMLLRAVRRGSRGS